MMKELNAISPYEEWELVNILKSSSDRLLHDIDVARHLETKEVYLLVNLFSDKHQELSNKMDLLSWEERDVVIGLAADWHGTLEELIDTAKELTK